MNIQDDILDVIYNILKPLTPHYVLTPAFRGLGTRGGDHFREFINCTPRFKNHNFHASASCSEEITISLHNAELFIRSVGTPAEWSMPKPIMFGTVLSLFHSLDVVFKELILIFIEFEKSELCKYRSASKRLVHRNGYDRYIVERIVFLSKLIGV
jgi:hypothetical protein